MPETPNHKYNIPELGAENWDQLLNENFEQIDSEVEIRDTEANKGDYTPKAGAKYEATDSGAVYLGNGETWVLINRRVKTLEADQNKIEEAVFSNSDERTGALLVDRNEDYRAVSFVTDEYWVDESDAAAVLQSLVDSILEAGSISYDGNNAIGTIRVGGGVFEFKQTLNVRGPGLSLVGSGSAMQSAGESATVFKADRDSFEAGDDLMFVGHIDQGNAGRNFQMRNMRIDGSEAGIYNIHIYDSDRFHISNVNSGNAANPSDGGEGLRVSGSYNSVIDRCLIENVHMRTNENTGKNINQLKCSSSIFQTSVDGVEAFRFMNGGNFFHDCVFNSGDPSGGVGDNPSFTSGDNGNGSRQTFTMCQFYATPRHGNPMFSSDIRGCNFIGCQWGGGAGPILRTVSNTSIVGGGAAPNHEFIKCSGGRSGTDKFMIQALTVRGANTNGGDSAIEITGGPNDDFLIQGCNFIQNNGDYDLDIAIARKCGVIGNKTPLGINVSLSGGQIRGSGSNPTVEGNVGYNPIGYSRGTPSLPSGTGASNTHRNHNPQTAHIWMSGPSDASLRPIVVENDDTTERDVVDKGSGELNGQANDIALAPFESIYFDGDDLPEGWIWRWE